MDFKLHTLPDRYAVTRDGVIVPDSCIQLMAGIEVRDPDGKLKHAEEIPARSILRWFPRMLQAICASSSTFTVTSMTNTSSVMPWDNSTALNAVANTVGKMYFGTGTTAPTATDYTIQTSHTSGNVSVVQTETSSASTCDVSCSVLALSSVSLAEIALSINMNNTSGTNIEFLLARDTFTPVPVVANDGVTGRYKFIFNV